MPAKTVERPEIRLLTVEQSEDKHQALKGKLRTWIHRADAGDADYVALRRAIVRVGRSVFLNDVALTEFFYQRSSMPPAPSRRNDDDRAAE
jgi:hypothetical protein